MPHRDRRRRRHGEPAAARDSGRIEILRAGARAAFCAPPRTSPDALNHPHERAPAGFARAALRELGYVGCPVLVPVCAQLQLTWSDHGHADAGVHILDDADTGNYSLTIYFCRRCRSRRCCSRRRRRWMRRRRAAEPRTRPTRVWDREATVLCGSSALDLLEARRTRSRALAHGCSRVAALWPVTCGRDPRSGASTDSCSVVARDV